MSFTSLGQDFEVQFIKVPKGNIPVGETESILIEVTNLNEKPLDLTYSLKVPQKWLNLNGAEKQIQLAPNEKRRLFFTFRPASTVSAGDQQLQFIIGKTGETPIAYPVEMTVQKTFKVSLSSNSRHNYAIAGSEVDYNYSLSNRGNTPTLLKIKTNGCDVADLDPDSVYLGPGDYLNFKVMVKTPSNLLYDEEKRFKIEVSSNEFDTSFTHYNKIDVYPDGQTQEATHQKMPVRINLNYLGRQNNSEYSSGIQGDIFARGAVDAQRKHIIELHLRGPDRTQYSTFGNFDEYYLKYETKNYGFWVGDQVIRLSRLTEFGRYVRGASAYVQLNNTRLEVASGRTRFFPSVKSESTFKLSQQIGEKWELGGGMLYKDYAENDSAASIPMVFANYTSENFRMEAEGSYGTTGDKDGYAYRLQAAGKVEKFRYTLGFIQADAFYPGFLQNSIAVNSSVGLNFDKLNVSVNGSYNDRNPALDTFFLTAPFSYAVSGNIAYRINNGTRSRLTFGQRRRKDRMSMQLFDYKEDFVRINLSKNFERLSLGVLSEYQINTNFQLPGDDRLSQGYMVGGSMGYKIGEKLGFSSYANYLETSRYSQSRFRILIFSMESNWQVTQRTALSFNYQNNYDIEDYYRTQDYVGGRLEQRIGRSHVLALSTRYTKPRRQGNKQLFVNARYTYEFGMPIRRIKGHGKVKGRVTMNDSIPLKGVLVRISGQKAVTDKDGYYMFPKVLENFYFMTLDRTSFDISLISKVPQPYRVEVSSNQTITQNINLVKASHIKGVISIPKNANQLLDEKESQSIPIYLELKNENESFIKKVNPDGTFEFNHLRPGAWDIRIIKSTIDRSLEFRKTEDRIDLKPGETGRVEFRANKKQKKLKLVSPPLKLTAKSKADLGGTD